MTASNVAVKSGAGSDNAAIGAPLPIAIIGGAAGGGAALLIAFTACCCYARRSTGGKADAAAQPTTPVLIVPSRLGVSHSQVSQTPSVFVANNPMRVLTSARNHENPGFVANKARGSERKTPTAFPPTMIAVPGATMISAPDHPAVMQTRKGAIVSDEGSAAPPAPAFPAADAVIATLDQTVRILLQSKGALSVTGSFTGMGVSLTDEEADGMGMRKWKELTKLGVLV